MDKSVANTKKQNSSKVKTQIVKDQVKSETKIAEKVELVENAKLVPNESSKIRIADSSLTEVKSDKQGQLTALAGKVVTAVGDEVTTVKHLEKLTMDDLLAKRDYKLVVPRKGDSVKGVIVAKQKRSLIIDIGSKTEGIVSGKEYDFASEFIDDLKVGDSVKAIVVSSENDRGQVVLSLKNAASEAKWDYFVKAMEEETILEAKGIEVNKGGLIVVVNGVRGFVPSSQFGRQFVGKVNQLKGETFKVKAIEVNSANNRLIFSERHVSEAKELSQRDEALSQVKIGSSYSGVVSGVMHFGLFVTVEIPVEVQLPITAEAQSKVALSKLESQKVEKETEKQEETITQTSEDKQPSCGYVEGLIHISEISWEKVNHPRDYHQVGDKIRVKVLGIDERTGKLNLSIKQLQEDPWLSIETRYPVGTTFTGQISRIEQFGVFVNVEPGVDGLIHVTKLNPDHNLEVGKNVTVSVENIAPAQRRMSLSLVLTSVPMGYK